MADFSFTSQEELERARREHEERQKKFNEASRRPPNGDGRHDTRQRILVPKMTDPLQPIMDMLDAALLTNALEPPMRNVDIENPALMEVRECRPLGLHLLTCESVNADGSKTKDRKTKEQAPPPVNMLMPCNETGIHLMIGNHIQFYKEVKTKQGIIEVDTRLPDALVKKYMEHRDSKLPKVSVLLTLPIVFPNGKVLATNGLDRKTGALLRIEPEILALLPKGVPTSDDVKEAMRFIMDDWFCDVLADYEGKCVLLALTLSLLERALLAQRPFYIVTAGRRGGGKTTVLSMISTALYGVMAAASAWTDDECERKKALFSYLRQGVPFVVFDNIKLGTVISSACLEAACTADTYRDRVLSESRFETVSCHMQMAATGNNILTGGDLASRTLAARLNTDRSDPENRTFIHPNPIEWTRENRHKIIAALYTILLGNPRLRQSDSELAEAKTRYKDWWHLCGSPIEYAAGLCGYKMNDGSPIDFGAMFKQQEDEDEEGASLGDVLVVLETHYQNGKTFTAGDVKKMLEGNNDRVLKGDLATMKAFLMTPGSEIVPMSKTIGKRLSECRDNPQRVICGNKNFELTLKRNEPDHTGTPSFWIAGRNRSEEGF